MAPYCFPAFSGVPGSSATNLDWWTTAPSASQPEDPNWLGAFSIADGDGAGAQMRFRALHGINTFAGTPNTKMLYLAWIAHVSAAPALNLDGINLLLGAGTNALVVKVRLATTSNTLAGDATKYAVDTFNYSGTTLSTPHATKPAWLTTSGRIWIDFDSPFTGRRIPWAFMLAVPIGQNLAPAGALAITLGDAANFRIWYQAQVTMPGGDVVEYPWSGTPYSESNVNIIPAALTPAEARVSGGVACEPGVTLNWSGVTIRNSDGTARANNHTVQLDLTGSPPNFTQPQHQNMFVAQPDVSSLAGGQETSIRARFRLANWGSQLSIPTPNSWKTIPGGDDVGYAAALGSAPAGCRAIWPKAGMNATETTFTTAFINGVKAWLSSGGTTGQHPHQCLLVELSSNDANIVFTKSSVFINTQVVDASTFERLAEISVVGMQPISAAPRDVFLYLETFNMPKRVKPNDPSFVADFTRGMSTFRRQQFFEVDDLLSNVPVYRVHAFADTGDRLALEDGSSVRILRPQTSFGYLVNHTGPLVGWETRLNGARRIAENYYLVEVPNFGSVNILTQIQARESEDERPLPPESEAPIGSRGGGGDGCLPGLLRVIGRLLRGQRP